VTAAAEAAAVAAILPDDDAGREARCEFNLIIEHQMRHIDIIHYTIIQYIYIYVQAPLYPHRTLWRYTNVVLLLLLLLYIIHCIKSNQRNFHFDNVRSYCLIFLDQKVLTRRMATANKTCVSGKN